MKILKLMALLYIILGLCMDNVKAQLTQEMSYPNANGIASKSIVNRDTIYRRVNIFEISLPAVRIPAWTDVTEIPWLTFIDTSRDYFDLKNTPALFYDTLISLTGKPAMAGFRNTGTFNGRLEILKMKPVFAIGRYNSQSIKPNEPSFSDNLIYRMAGNIFNFYTETKYPILSSLEK
jgi:hypothetical protein